MIVRLISAGQILRPAATFSRLTRLFSEVPSETQPLRTEPLKISEYSTSTAKKVNYNLEENPKYTAKVQKAQEQRDLLHKLEAAEIIPRRQRRVYDRPKHDLNIAEYDCFRNIVDPMPKHSPHMYEVEGTISAPPALVEKAFGLGFKAFRNGHYSTKEWDFTDSNYDRFLVYDYKGTTAYWGPNLHPAEYEVSLS